MKYYFALILPWLITNLFLTYCLVQARKEIIKRDQTMTRLIFYLEDNDVLVPWNEVKK